MFADRFEGTRREARIAGGELVLFLEFCSAIALLSLSGVRAAVEANADADSGTDCDPPGKQYRPKRA
jgi:hypothetical protein